MSKVRIHPEMFKDLLEAQEKMNKSSHEPKYFWFPEELRRHWEGDAHNRKIVKIVDARMRARGWVK